MLAIRSTGVASLMRILGCEARVQILRHLAALPVCVHEISKAIGARQQATSHHLKILMLQRLVSRRRIGKQNFYGLTERGSSALDLFERAERDSRSQWGDEPLEQVA